MKYWWVNQNQTYKYEVPGGFLWSPKTRKDGGRHQYYENMKAVEAGDIVFSFCDTRIKALGMASGTASTSPKPDFEGAGETWSTEGWFVPVEFEELANASFRPRDHMDKLEPLLPEKYSPLQKDGRGIQSVYLAELPLAMANALIALLGSDFEEVISRVSKSVDTFEVEERESSSDESLIGRTDIAETTKQQLVQARRGQGLFKSNVRLNEKGCRITGVVNPKHLRASHIKPWAQSSDKEKLNGCNGLLLAPHIDHLFDRGMISFENNGDLLVSSKLDRSVLNAWSISTKQNVGSFKEEQARFLQFHREHVFQK